MNELIIIEEVNPLVVFTTEGIEPFLAKIKEEVDRHILNTDTKKGRDEITSLAYKIAQSKTLLDNLGKDLVADWKAKAKAVDESRKKAREFLDDLKVQVRQPLEEWKALEDARIKAEAAKIEQERKLKEIAEAYDAALIEDELFNRQRAIELKEAAIAKQAKELADKIEQERREKELAEAELARQAAELAAKTEALRLAKEQKELKDKRDAELAKEAAERAERLAEEKIRVEKEKAIAEERARVEKEKAIVEEQRIAKAKEEARRVAYELNVKRIQAEVLEYFLKILNEDAAHSLVQDLHNRKVPHLTINY